MQIGLHRCNTCRAVDTLFVDFNQFFFLKKNEIIRVLFGGKYQSKRGGFLNMKNGPTKSTTTAPWVQVAISSADHQFVAVRHKLVPRNEFSYSRQNSNHLAAFDSKKICRVHSPPQPYLVKYGSSLQSYLVKYGSLRFLLN